MNVTSIVVSGFAPSQHNTWLLILAATLTIFNGYQIYFDFDFFFFISNV